MKMFMLLIRLFFYMPMIAECAGSNPVGVYFALEDPQPGFTPSLMGLVGLHAVTGTGLLKAIYVDKNSRLDITPQDVAVKNMMYFTLKTCRLYEHNRPQDIPVFITSSDRHCSLTLIENLKILNDFGVWKKSAFEKNLLLPGIHNTSNRFVYMSLVFILQLLPALLVDSILRLSGRKPVVMSVQRKIFTTLEVMQPFMFNNYESNGITDFEKIKEKCKGTNFNVDILLEGDKLSTVIEYGEATAFGVRHLLLKEDPKTLQRSKRIFIIKEYLYKFIKFHLFYKVVIKLLDYAANLLTEWRTNGLSCEKY